ncbi:hypothetical protein [Halosimplex pelagicum]|uniref:DUF8173 domain-containing protein n=1 Tax=Halosimplex pelagicum TaxID=869886 RepID=A0A7D5TSH2_9EURY|nr:hypothetical protein [Halosimplex pelagicum]QLH80554.1 hypothetical protein HZS54_02415 [Halosimplex pelagicum]
MLAALAAFSDVLLQVNVDIDLNPVTDVIGSAVGSFLTTLVVGAVLTAVAPEFLEDRMAAVVDDPVGSFVYGFLVLIFAVLAVVVLFFTLIGIPLALGLGLLVYLVWAVGAAVAFLAIAERFVDREGDDWGKTLLVAAALNGGLVLTGVGGVLAFCIGAAGFGAVLEDRL